MLRRFQLEVSDAFEDVAQVHDELIVDRAYRPEFAINQHLEPWITKRRQDGHETRVTVFWRCQLVMLGAHLTIVSNISGARQDVNRPVRRQRVVLKPGVEEISILTKANCEVFEQLQR